MRINPGIHLVVIDERTLAIHQNHVKGTKSISTRGSATIFTRLTRIPRADKQSCTPPRQDLGPLPSIFNNTPPSEVDFRCMQG